MTNSTVSDEEFNYNNVEFWVLIVTTILTLVINICQSFFPDHIHRIKIACRSSKSEDGNSCFDLEISESE